MKTCIGLIIVGTMAWFATEVGATPLDMRGAYSYYVDGNPYYFAYGASQSGRYSNLGAGDYNYGNIRVGRIHNLSFDTRSGSLSIEFWGMPYFGANTGFVKMTSNVNPIPSNSYRYPIYRANWMKAHYQWLWPEINLFEYTASGWRWRDDLRFNSAFYF